MCLSNKPLIYIVSVHTNNYVDFLNRFKNILEIDVSYPYTLTAIQPVDAANITQFHGESFLNLTGENTIAAIIDTGIDYLNSQFQNDDGTTRIAAIWDQTIQSNPTTKMSHLSELYILVKILIGLF